VYGVGAVAVMLLLSFGKIGIWQVIRRLGNGWKTIANVIVKIKFFIISAVALIVIVNMVRELLLSETREIVIVGTLILATFFFLKENTEVYARFTEVLFYPVIFMIALVLFLSVFSIHGESVDLRHVTSLEIEALPAKQWLLKIFLCLLLFLPWDGPVVYERNHRRSAFKAAAVSWGITAVFIVVMSLLPGIEVMSDISYPFVTMLKIAGIPGGFLERQEALFGIFVVMALVIAFLYDVKMVTGNKGRDWCRWTVVVTLTVCSLVYLQGYNHMRPAGSGKDKIFAALDVENRMFVYAIGVDKKDDEYVVTYDVGKMMNCSGDIVEIPEKFRKECEKYPDYSHVKVILLGEEIWKNEEATEKVRDFMEKNAFGLNAIVCRCEGNAEDIMVYEEGSEKISGERDSFGESVLNVLKNNGYKYSNILYFQDIFKADGIDAFRRLPLIRSSDGKYHVVNTF